jgi:type II secretory pathway pseudopilin PulG
VRRAIYLIPVLGIAAAVALPLVRHVQKQQRESRAVDALEAVRAAQERFRTAAGGYATGVESLVAGCAAAGPALDAGWLARLDHIGYGLQLRAAEGAATFDEPDCQGRPIAADYYVAAAPIDAAQPAQEAFAARAQSGVYLFYDGLAPREADIDSGLATPLEQQGTFKIP